MACVHCAQERASAGKTRQDLNVARKSRRNSAEDQVDTRRNSAHPRNCAKRNQRNDERIFNQILAFLAREKLADKKAYSRTQHVHTFLRGAGYARPLNETSLLLDPARGIFPLGGSQ